MGVSANLSHHAVVWHCLCAQVSMGLSGHLSGPQASGAEGAMETRAAYTEGSSWDREEICFMVPAHTFALEGILLKICTFTYKNNRY